ncbi:hypothetical protein ACLKA6_006062 [Drosophila palustris]
MQNSNVRNIGKISVSGFQFHSSSGVAVGAAVDAVLDGASLGRNRHMAPVRAVATQCAESVVRAGRPLHQQRLHQQRLHQQRPNRQWAPLDADGNVAPAQPRPVVQWVPLDADVSSRVGLTPPQCTLRWPQQPLNFSHNRGSRICSAPQHLKHACEHVSQQQELVQQSQQRCPAGT